MQFREFMPQLYVLARRGQDLKPRFVRKPSECKCYLGQFNTNKQRPVEEGISELPPSSFEIFFPHRLKATFGNMKSAFWQH
jgi:hypothetical protein